MSTRLPLLIATAAVLLAGCGDQQRVDQDPAAQVAPPTAVPAAAGTVTVRGPHTVLEDDRGTRLCLGVMAMSLPPQCDGVPLEAWDWSEHRGDFQRGSGVRWGSFVVTGTFDGQQLTVTDAVAASEYDGPPERSGPDLSSPCPAAELEVVDPGKVDPVALDSVLTEASALRGYAEAWLDDRGSGSDAPGQVVVNVRVTGDPEVAEKRLRQVWGGRLCVTRARLSQSELRQVARRLQRLPGALGATAFHDVVQVEVVHDDGSIQAWADDRWGEGAVEVIPQLVPAGD